MHKVPSPGMKRNSFIPKGLTIPDQPDVPRRSWHNFHEEGMPKRRASMLNAVKEVPSNQPINLHIVPNSCAEITSKEQMQSVLINLGNLCVYFRGSAGGVMTLINL